MCEAPDLADKIRKVVFDGLPYLVYLYFPNKLSKHWRDKIISIFLHCKTLFFLIFCINNKSRITHLKLLWLAHKGGGRPQFCRHSWPCCRQPEASSREKNILGGWLTTNFDLIVRVIFFWQERCQTSDNNCLLILSPRLVVTNLQQFTILIAIRDNYHNGWIIILYHQITVPMSSPSPPGQVSFAQLWNSKDNDHFIASQYQYCPSKYIIKSNYNIK